MSPGTTFFSAISPTMQATASFKLAFLRHMLVRLRLSGVSSSTMGILDRKRAIMHAAEMAMAVARGGGARWSRALIAEHSWKEEDKALARNTMGCLSRLHYAPRVPSSKKTLKRRFQARSRTGKCPPALHRAASASLLARRMVKKRTQVLKRLVPGGEAMDGLSLVGEALDYVVFLRAQVDLMRRLTDALGLVHCKLETFGSHPAGSPQEKDT